MTTLGRLRKEFESGQARLAEIEVEHACLRERMLMLKGAIGVLEDLLTAEVTGAGERAPLATATRSSPQ